MLTGDTQLQKQIGVIKQLKGEVVTEVDQQFDILVVLGKLIRNAKLLIAISRHTPIVSREWLADSKSRGEFIEPTGNHLIKSREFNKQYHCNLEYT